jgi:TatD DNase family protein
MKYFDAHCHIQFDMFDEDREDVLRSMQEQEIGGLVVGVDLESSKKAVAMARRSAADKGIYAANGEGSGKKQLFAGVGLHPNDVEQEEFSYAEYLALAKDPSVVTIGECGLDYFRPADFADNEVSIKRKQREVFEKHIQLAVETQKPLMIHARPSKGTQDAYHDLIQMLTDAKREHGDKLTGNVHFFVGQQTEAGALFYLNFTISLTAVITFTHDYDEVVRYSPLTHMLTETDSPYASPPPNRGKRNDPRSIPKVVEAIARIRGLDERISMDSSDGIAVRTQLLQNAQNLFALT